MKLFDMRQTESEALSVLEGVNMSGKALTKALGDTKGITIGWEVEFSSDELESEDWWSENNYSFDHSSMNEADEHPEWSQRVFDQEYSEWHSERRMEYYDDNSYRFDEDAWDDIYHYYLDDEKGEVGKVWADDRADEFQEEDEDGNEKYNETDIFNMVWEEYEDQIEAQAKSNLQESHEEEHREKRDELLEEAFDEDEDYTEETYFDEHRYDLYTQMDIYETGGGDGEIGEDSLRSMAGEIEELLGIEFDEVCVGWHCADGKTKDGWYMETDGDGPELISAALPMDESLDKLEKALKFVDARGTTDDSQGLHIGVSLDGVSGHEYNLLKIAMFIGEDYLLKQYGREGNGMTKPQKDTMKNNIRLLQKFGAGEESHGSGTKFFGDEELNLSTRDLMAIALGDYDKIIGGVELSNENRKKVQDQIETLGRNIFQAPLFADRYRTFNLEKLEDKHYIEFRIMGGEDYHKRFDEIKTTVARYAYVMRLATDPKLEVNEYYKKLAKFLGEYVNTDPLDKGQKRAELLKKNFMDTFPKQKWETIGRMTYARVDKERIWMTVRNIMMVKSSEVNSGTRNNIAKLLIGLAYHGYVGNFDFSKGTMWIRHFLKGIGEAMDRRQVAEHIYSQLAWASEYDEEAELILPNGDEYKIPPIAEMHKDPMLKALFDIKW